MEYAETLKWTGVYLGYWLLAGAVGGAIVVVGIALGGLAAVGAGQLTPVVPIADAPIAGVATIGLGLLVFKLGSTAALVHVIVGATEPRVSAALDTETLKSDILSVLDERLSEMHADLRETRQFVSQFGGAEEEGFEFE